MKALKLVLTEKWYDMIASGEKKEEYREITPYWANRLLYHCNLGVKQYWEEYLPNRIAFIEQYPYLHKKDIIRDYGYRHYPAVEFQRAYPKNPPRMAFAIEEITIGTGRTEWGAEEGKEYFVIKLGERKEL